MTVYTFADLSTPESIATIRARLVANLIADGVPVGSWAPTAAGGVENMRLDMVASGMAGLSASRIAQAVRMRGLPLAVQDATADPTGSAGLGLKKLGLDFYNLKQRDATSTIQNIRLSTTGTPSAYTFQPGDLWAQADATGNKYQSITGGVLSPGGTLDLQYQAENPGSAYADPPGTILTMVTARAGVKCTNIAPSDFTPSRTTGGSSGTIVGKLPAPPFDAPVFWPPISYSSIRVRIIASGEIGTATFAYSLDGGLTWIEGATIPSSLVISEGVTLTFANGTAPSFIIGDILTLFLGDAILQRGADAESPEAFGRRCSNRWPALSLVPTASTIELWAHQASDEVAKVASDADPNTPGGTLVTIASSSGPASAQAQVAVEDYISLRLRGFKGVPAATGFTSPEETVLVSSAVARVVKPTGNVFVPRSRVASIQVAANVAWNAYLRGVALGGQRGAVVRAAVLADILADAGVTNVAAIAVNGLADLTLNSNEVAVMAAGTTLINTLLWVPV